MPNKTEEFVAILKNALPCRTKSRSTDKLIAELAFASSLDRPQVKSIEITWETIYDGCDSAVMFLPHLKVEMKS